MRRFSLLVVGSLAACAAAAPQPPVPGVRGSVVCRNFDPGGFVGREATDGLREGLRRASGARTVRLVRPGMMVTMEYREDRLTVHVDERNRVVRASCG